jgi:4-hydroxy-tetrahydrodipicolinate reductase
MGIRVCVAGATGWVGRALIPAIAISQDLVLGGAVSRSHSGQSLGEVLALPHLKLTISRCVEDALAVPTDVLIDYTSPHVVKSNVLHAISQGCGVVIGTSGLTEADYKEIDAAALRKRVGVLAAGNFAVTAALQLKFALMAARFAQSWEIIDYAHADKIDAPSGMTRELAHRLSLVRAPVPEVPIEETRGPKESRGVTLDGTQVHSIRLPGYIIAAEVHFGLPNQRLSIRYEAGSGAEPYVEGTLLAVRKVGSFTGLRRGLDQFLDLGTDAGQFGT